MVTIPSVAQPHADDDLLTLQEAAEALGVHYMTAYRWVRQGDLPAIKDGGRLRVRRDDLDACRRARDEGTNGPVERDDDDTVRERQLHVDRLLQQLVNGEASEANATVRELVRDGLSVGDLYTQVLTPALHRIGDMWEVGAISVAVEHRATAITSGIMSRLSEHFERRGPRRGVAATVTAPGEAHGVATARIADFLRAAGFPPPARAAAASSALNCAAVNDDPTACGSQVHAGPFRCSYHSQTSNQYDRNLCAPKGS